MIAHYIDDTVAPCSSVKSLRAFLPHLSEIFWGGLSLALFMILGPFAAPVALVAVFGLDSRYRGECEPEPAEEGLWD
jgi:hypothetical protein